MTFSVIDLIRGEGYEPEPRISWAIGAAVSDRYIDWYGGAPVKALRPKTTGPGSHCFACYPDEFRPEAIAVVRQILAELAAARQAQPSLW